jgi:hypothetical protein
MVPTNSSLPRKRESRSRRTRPLPWMPAFAGMTLDRNKAVRRAYIPSRTKGLRKVPMPVISISQTSPCFRLAGAPSVPIQTTSPG